MDVLIVLAGLVGVFAFSAWSCGRSYYEKGKVRGIRDAVRELQVGMKPQLGAEVAPDLIKALTGLDKCLERHAGRRDRRNDLVHAPLWELGAVLAEQCWSKGHGAGVRRKAPAEGKIRIDLSVTELLQLGGLANVGFQSMMPNFRMIDVRRFADKDDALDASRSISKVEAAIPSKFRPDLLLQVESRESLIEDWWDPIVRKATA